MGKKRWSTGWFFHSRSGVALVGTCVLLSCGGGDPPPDSAPSVSYPTLGSIERPDPRLDAIVPADAVLEVLSEGHDWVEGPVWVPELQPEVDYSTFGGITPSTSGFLQMQPRSDGIAVGGTSERGNGSLEVDEDARRRIVEAHIELFSTMRVR